MRKSEFEGTVSVITSDPHAKSTMPDSQWYPKKLCLTEEKLLSSIAGFSTKVTCEFLQQLILEI